MTAQRASNNRSFQNIHGCTFRMDEIAFDVKRGAVEIWRINYPAERVSREIGYEGHSDDPDRSNNIAGPRSTTVIDIETHKHWRAH